MSGKHAVKKEKNEKKDNNKKEKKEKKEKKPTKVEENVKEKNNKLFKPKTQLKLPQDVSQEILKKMFKSLLYAVCITLYFIILNLAYLNMNLERLTNDIQVFSAAFLVVAIVCFERAYKNDNGSIAINGIEFLVLSLHSLSIMHVITLFQYNFRFYLLTSSYVFSIYYVMKAIILYTKDRRDYLKSLSDISEIVKKEKPVKKEAKKRKKKKEVNKND